MNFSQKIVISRQRKITHAIQSGLKDFSNLSTHIKDNVYTIYHGSKVLVSFSLTLPMWSPIIGLDCYNGDIKSTYAFSYDVSRIVAGLFLILDKTSLNDLFPRARLNTLDELTELCSRVSEYYGDKTDPKHKFFSRINAISRYDGALDIPTRHSYDYQDTKLEDSDSVISLLKTEIDTTEKAILRKVRVLYNNLNPLARSLLFMDHAFLSVSDINSAVVARKNQNFKNGMSLLTRTLRHPDYQYLIGLVGQNNLGFQTDFLEAITEDRRFNSRPISYWKKSRDILIEAYQLALASGLEQYGRGYFLAALKQINEILMLERHIRKMRTSYKRMPSSALLSVLQELWGLTKNSGLTPTQDDEIVGD